MHKVLVTGSSGLIGSALCRYLEDQCDYRVIRADVNLATDAVTRYYNLMDIEAVKVMCADHVDCDVLINCFGYNDHIGSKVRASTILDIDPEQVGDIMNVNVTALFAVCQQFAKVRLGQGGIIINFGASTGIVTPRTDIYGGQHKNIGYSTSKAAVIHMTKILATHLITLDSKMRVNCISPGGIEATQDEEFKKLYGTHTPSGRMCKVEELFPAIDMLLDETNSYMIGANIIVDGGWTIQ